MSDVTKDGLMIADVNIGGGVNLLVRINRVHLKVGYNIVETIPEHVIE